MQTAIMISFIAVLGLSLAGCSQLQAGHDKPAAATAALPAVQAELPAVQPDFLRALPALPTGEADMPLGRAVSATDNVLAGNAVFSTSPSGALVNGSTLELDGNSGIAWAIYQWSAIGSEDSLLQLSSELDVSSGVQAWIARSNYASRHWEISGPLDSATETLPYADSAAYVSAAGNTYAGLIVSSANKLIVNQLNLRLERAGGGTVLISEPFEDQDYASRGWYDSPGFSLTEAEHAPGNSTRAVEFRFEQGATKPTVGGGRILFPETESVYLSYWVKYSSNWTGSNKPYHPHEFHFVTNADSMWVGPAFTHLTTYIEDNEGVPLLAIQDGENIDQTQIGVDLSEVTELRGIAGCNGSTDGYPDDCYVNGPVHVNGKQWKADGVYFSDKAGPHYKSDWHFIEAYFQLNSIAGAKGLPDGIVRYWYDGQVLIDHSDVLLRTAAQPDMKFNQFLVLPYIGDGSPVAQTMWIDDLTVATARP